MVSSLRSKFIGYLPIGWSDVFSYSFLLTSTCFSACPKNIGSVSWVHNLLCSVCSDDCWFKRYVMAYLLLYCPFFFLQVHNSFLLFPLPCAALRAVIYRWQVAVPPTLAFLKIILGFFNFAYTVLVLNYSCVGFMVPLSLACSVALSRRAYTVLMLWCFGRSWACTRRLPRMEACTTSEPSFPSHWSYLAP